MNFWPLLFSDFQPTNHRNHNNPPQPPTNLPPSTVPTKLHHSTTRSTTSPPPHSFFDGFGLISAHTIWNRLVSSVCVCLIRLRLCYSLFSVWPYLFAGAHAFPTGSRYCRAELLLGFALACLVASWHRSTNTGICARCIQRYTAVLTNSMDCIDSFFVMLASRWRLDAGLSAHL
jgi:hypothetical protein